MECTGNRSRVPSGRYDAHWAIPGFADSPGAKVARRVAARWRSNATHRGARAEAAPSTTVACAPTPHLAASIRAEKIGQFFAGSGRHRCGRSSLAAVSAGTLCRPPLSGCSATPCPARVPFPTAIALPRGSSKRNLAPSAGCPGLEVSTRLRCESCRRGKGIRMRSPSPSRRESWIPVAVGVSRGAFAKGRTFHESAGSGAGSVDGDFTGLPAAGGRSNAPRMPAATTAASVPAANLKNVPASRASLTCGSVREETHAETPAIYSIRRQSCSTS